MTTHKLRKLIDEAVELDRQIRDAEAALKDTKAKLMGEALTRPEEHVATAGGGWSWQYAGDSGAICRVTQEGDKLKSSVSTEKDVAALKDAAGEAGFRALFVPAICYKPVARIREEAPALLDKPGLRKLWKVLTGKGRVTVGFETKKGDNAQ
jgi:hypothetical protein